MQSASVSAHNFIKSLRACPDCGQLNELPKTEPGMMVECCRCGKIFRHMRAHSLEKTLCFAIAGFIFYLLLATAPILDVSLYGRFRSSMVQTGANVFDQQRLWMLGAALIFTTIAMPCVKLLLTLVVLLGLKLRNPPRMLVDCFRLIKEVSKWAMLEVYLLGFLVAYTRLQALVFVQLDIAVYALVGTILATAMVDVLLDAEAVWEEMERKGLTSPITPEPGKLVMGCENCSQVSHSLPHTPCPRCGATLHTRKPGSIMRSWALAIGAVIFYLPANYFPVMIITKFHKTTEHTIIGGMLEFVQAGMWPLALLVFVASIVIPLLKLVALVYMLVQTHLRSDKNLLLKTRLYRLIEFIGRWSMVDVFMVSILIGLVQFGQFAEIRSDIGAACFATVVILTILAVDSFDTRLMWDAAEQRRALRAQEQQRG